MTLTEIDTFFNNHPLKEKYFSFSESERAGCFAVAERDVTAAAARCLPLQSDETQRLFDAAVAEQTVFLMLNPEYLTGNYTRTESISSAGENRRFSEQNSVLGQRTAALLAALPEGVCTNEPDGQGTSEVISGSLILQRG